MPDHFHVIVKNVHTKSGNNTVGTGRDLSLQCNNPEQNNNNSSPRKYKPLDQIIGAFKTSTFKLIHLSGYTDHEGIRQSPTDVIFGIQQRFGIENICNCFPESCF